MRTAMAVGLMTAFALCALAKTINVPVEQIEDVLTVARGYIAEKKIDVTHHFIGTVEYVGLHDEYNKPFWRVTWLLTAGATQGQIIVDVCEDGTIQQRPLPAISMAVSPSLTVDWGFAEGTTNHAVMVRINNVTGQEIRVQHPAKYQAITFVVMNDRGNIVQPQFVAKVEAIHREDPVLKLGEAFEYTDTQSVELAHTKGLALPFLSGTGLFAYELKGGSSYRVTVIYRPYADLDVVASREYVFMFK